MSANKPKEEIFYSDIIAEDIENGHLDTYGLMLISYTINWLKRQSEAIQKSERTPHRIAIDIAESIEFLCTEDEFKKLFKDALDAAIFNEYKCTVDE